ncbi:indole-3-glycerol phosphate synthase TrpC [uncultured Duncaniella sp.]|uniref:indole-3-glycerol phosphate synthase TrpC n=1 Tax=uncultured Duncaniella sp. TaxID=2768039 RepID=UPI0025AA24CF|nr:indole-3-glycerol phosphate synthase TrpC [uncultured Duncaniella sp.]
MPNILDKIIANKKREIEASCQLLGEEVAITTDRPTVSMKQALLESPTGIIAEFKRRSPSKGEIHPLALVNEVIPAYQKAGASACSVLTDTVYFGGALTDLANARSVSDIPLLRKDFIVSRRQIAEARAYGADAILLIAAALGADEIEDFTHYAHSLELEVLFEIHNIAELDKYYPGVDMVGVNNRDLTTFVTDPMLSEKVAGALPADVVKIAESGLTSINEVEQLRASGFSGFLIGETFMRHDRPGDALRKFLDATL